MKISFGGAWILALAVLKFTVNSDISWWIILAPVWLGLIGIVGLAFLGRRD